MEPLAQRRDLSKNVGPFLGYDEGFIPDSQFETERLAYWSKLADRDGVVPTMKRRYEGVHEFVNECIAQSLMYDSK